MAYGPVWLSLRGTVGMWPEPIVRLRELAHLLRPCGRIALVSQLAKAGFEHMCTEILDLDPPAICVIGHTPPADDTKLTANPPARS